MWTFQCESGYPGDMAKFTVQLCERPAPDAKLYFSYLHFVGGF